MITPTRLWGALQNRLRALRPRLLIVENLADVFASNELNRTEARACVGLLTQAAVEFDLAVVLIGHPSLSGMSSGAGTSGSTAWSNSVRSRLYLDRVRGGEDEADPDLRTLKLLKANYTAIGQELQMRYLAGRFVSETVPHVGTFSRLLAERNAEDVFLEMLVKLREQGRELSHKRSPAFAPSIISRQPECKVSKKFLEAAMDRLLADRRIRIEEHGPPSRRSTRLVVKA